MNSLPHSPGPVVAPAGTGEEAGAQLPRRGEQPVAQPFALAMTEERERRALAQDLHDDLGQLLAIVRIKLAVLEEEPLSAAQRQVVMDIAGLVAQANRSVRSLAFQLSPPVLYQLGLVPALEWLAGEMDRQYGLAVRVLDDGRPKPLEHAVSTSLFRSVRELLINVAKHAGTRSAEVVCRRGDDDTLTITVGDSGRGFDQLALPGHGHGGGFGLISVKERLGYLGGEMRVDSVPGQGTRIVLGVPLSAALAQRREPP